MITGWVLVLSTFALGYWHGYRRGKAAGWINGWRDGWAGRGEAQRRERESKGESVLFTILDETPRGDGVSFCTPERLLNDAGLNREIDG